MEVDGDNKGDNNTSSTASSAAAAANRPMSWGDFGRIAEHNATQTLTAIAEMQRTAAPNQDTSDIPLATTSAQINSIHRVLNIPHLMEQIVSNVVDLKSRAALDHVSRQFHHLSRKTPFAFPLYPETLRLTFRHWFSAALTVGIGTIEMTSRVDALTQNSRGDYPVGQQPPEIMTLIDRIVSRVGPQHIHRLQIGVISEEDSARGVLGHLLLCTAGLLQYIDERLPAVTAIDFANCVFDHGASQYLLSPACKFPHRLAHLSFNRCSFDQTTPNIVELAMRKLITRRLRTFSINMFSLTSQGEGFLVALETLYHRLDTLDVFIDEQAFSTEVTAADGWVFLKRCAERAKDLRLHFRKGDPRHSPKLFAVARDCFQFSKLSELDIGLPVQSQEELDNLEALVKGLYWMRLKSFDFGGFSYRLAGPKCKTILKALAANLHQQNTLEKFSISSIAREYEQLVGDVLDALPSTVTHLKIQGINVRDSKMTDVVERLPGLKTFIFNELPRVTPLFVYNLLKKLTPPKLNTVETDVVCRPEILHFITDYYRMPDLQHVILHTDHYPGELIDILARNYRSYMVDTVGLPKFRTAYMITCHWRRADAPPPDRRSILDTKHPHVKPQRGSKRGELREWPAYGND
ncbi:unnamed protein product, partial [Mesorhabditis spiculigera]